MHRANRLRTSQEFSWVYRSGKRVRVRGVAAVAAQTDLDDVRVGVSCSRRIGGAVQRNRAKRRLRAASTGVIERLAPGSRVVLAATQETTQLNFQNLVEDVERALAQTGVLDG